MSVGAKARCCVAVLGSLIALPCLSAPMCVARSRPHPEVQPPSTGALIYFGSSHGYELGIWMPSPKIAILYAFRQVGEESEGSSNSSSAFLQSAYAVFPGVDPLQLTGSRFAIDYCVQLGCIQREADA